MIENLQRQITQLKDDIRTKDVEIDAIQKRRVEDERDRDFMIREERGRTSKELDKQEKQLRELHTQKQIELSSAQTRIDSMHQELTATQKETKQGSQMVAELKVANANLENQVANLRREVDEARQETKRVVQTANENINNNAEMMDHAGGHEDMNMGGDRVPLVEA